MKNTLITTLTVILLANNLFAEIDQGKAVDIGSKTASIALKGVVSELENSLKASGPKETVKFCNENLPAIMTKIKAELGQSLTIQRKTDKARNPKNVFDEIDQIAFDYFKNNPPGQDVHFIKETKDNFIYFKPIYIKPPCLLCHGENIETSLYDEIKRLYPNDRATGYKLGDLRGLIRIEIQK